MDEAVAQTADITEIMRYLPHRYPFLLIDKVIRIRGDEFGVGIKNVTMNEPQFQGHFPERPVMPGVLMIEAMAQTAGVVALRAQANWKSRSSSISSPSTTPNSASRSAPATASSST